MLASTQTTRVVEHAPGLFSAKLIDGSRGAERLALLHGWLKPGARHALHTHPCEEVVYIISGEGVLEIEGEFFAVQAGSAMRFPPRVRHSTLNTHPSDDLVFVAAFSDQLVEAFPCVQPPREGRFAPLANRVRWFLRRLARRLRIVRPG